MPLIETPLQKVAFYFDISYTSFECSSERRYTYASFFCILELPGSWSWLHASAGPQVALAPLCHRRTTRKAPK